MFDWNDLRAFVAVAREGSTLAASRTLGVNQTTIARRLEALETAIDLKLVERGQAGSRLTEAGAALLAHAEAVERAAGAFGAEVEALKRGASGELRITVSESMAAAYVAPALADFRRAYPDIQIELMVTDIRRDLSKGEADIAIRGTNGPFAEPGLWSVRLTDIGWALYGGLDYVQAYGAVRDLADLAGHQLVGGEGDMENLPALRWLLERAPGVRTPTRSNSLTNLIVAVRSGLGLAPLPKLLADGSPDLVRLIDLPELTSGLHLVVREDLRDVPRVRAFLDFVRPHFAVFARRRISDGQTNQDRLSDLIAARTS